MLKGGTGKKRHAAVLDGLRSGGAPILLLATGAYLGEGFDLPILDTLFLAFPISGAAGSSSTSGASPALCCTRPVSRSTTTTTPSTRCCAACTSAASPP